MGADERYDPGPKNMKIAIQTSIVHQSPSQTTALSMAAGTNYGWLRSMYYGVIQQVVRQSPAYYIAYVALRQDHNY